MVHEQKFKDLLSSTCQVSVERILSNLELEVMRGPGSTPTGGNILSLDFFHVVKPLMPILPLLPILPICEKPGWIFISMLLPILYICYILITCWAADLEVYLALCMDKYHVSIVLKVFVTRSRQSWNGKLQENISNNCILCYFKFI